MPLILVRLSLGALILGVVFFLYYLDTGKRWAWGIAVALLTLGGLGLSFLLG